jgi:hypothetical protein
VTWHTPLVVERTTTRVCALCGRPHDPYVTIKGKKVIGRKEACALARPKRAIVRFEPFAVDPADTVRVGRVKRWKQKRALVAARRRFKGVLGLKATKRDVAYMVAGGWEPRKESEGF